MALIASNTFEVVDHPEISATGQAIVQPPASPATGRGRLVHPTFGTYDYVHTPTETVNVDGEVCTPPIWAHTMTLGGGIDVLWPGNVKDVQVVERWIEGDVGCPINHLRVLWAFFSNPPTPPDAVIWTPNYAGPNSYRVIIEKLTAGADDGYTLDRRLALWGYAPSPVELVMRVLGYAV